MSLTPFRHITLSLAIFGASMPASLQAADVYTQANLTSDVPGLAANTDPNLKNPWGVSFSTSGPFWVSNQGSDNSTIYNAAGAPQSLMVSTPPGGPTGQVFNGTGQFVEPGGQSPVFLFATLGGTIDGWNPANGTTASVLATTSGAFYTGLALANNGSGNFLYAANAAGSVDVFNTNFQHTALAGSFTDPNLPAGYTPYNIQLVNGNLYVTYAQGRTTGAGLGVVNEFDTNGNLIRRVATGGPLNAPWGLTAAPSGFGQFGGDLLVGNFGNGEINAFDPVTGAFRGTLTDSKGNPIINDGLWALSFRAPGSGFNANSLYFAAGINGEADGLFGSITPTPEPATFVFAGLGVAALAVFKRRRTLDN